jgi:hypothetical protein
MWPTASSFSLDNGDSSVRADQRWRRSCACSESLLLVFRSLSDFRTAKQVVPFGGETSNTLVDTWLSNRSQYTVVSGRQPAIAA